MISLRRKMRTMRTSLPKRERAAAAQAERSLRPPPNSSRAQPLELCAPSAVPQKEVRIGGGILENFGSHGTALGLIGVEQSFGGAPPCHQSELPTEIVSVTQAGVHSLPAERAVDVCRISGKQNPPASIGRGEPAVEPEHRD